jgi:hypothetical protein
MSKLDQEEGSGNRSSLELCLNTMMQYFKITEAHLKPTKSKEDFSSSISTDNSASVELCTIIEQKIRNSLNRIENEKEEKIKTV